MDWKEVLKHNHYRWKSPRGLQVRSKGSNPGIDNGHHKWLRRPPFVKYIKHIVVRMTRMTLYHFRSMYVLFWIRKVWIFRYLSVKMTPAFRWRQGIAEACHNDHGASLGVHKDDKNGYLQGFSNMTLLHMLGSKASNHCGFMVPRGLE